MKKMMAMTAIFAVTNVGAQELRFGELNYLLTKGQSQLSAEVNMRSYQVKQTDINSKTVEAEGYYTDYRFAHAFSDKLTAFAGLGYQFDIKIKEDDSTSYNQDGMNNPSVGFLYRLMNQNEAIVNFDFGATANMGIEDAESGSRSNSVNKDGNAANGRNSLDVKTVVGKKWNQANEWQATLGAFHHFDGKHKINSATGNSKLNDDSSTDIYLKAAYQYIPVDEFFMTFALQGTYIGATSSENKDTKVKTTSESHMDWDFTFNARYLVRENILVKFNYGLGNNPDYDGKIAGTKTKFQNRRENSYGLGIDWLF